VNPSHNPVFGGREKVNFLMVKLVLCSVVLIKEKRGGNMRSDNRSDGRGGKNRKD